MPESPQHLKRQPQRAAAAAVLPAPQSSQTEPRYAELHCKTNFSLLTGASHPDELVVRAAELGYTALAITDQNSLAGVVRAHAAVKESALKLLIGAEISPADAPRVVLLATDRAAYGRLCRLITLGRCRAPKGECELRLEDLDRYNPGLLACVILEQAERIEFPRALHQYRDIFGDRCYLLAELLYAANDRQRLEQSIAFSQQSRLPLAAAGDVHYHVRRRMALQHVLTAIRHGTSVAELGEQLLPNAQRHLKSLEEIQTIFSRAPDAVRRTAEVADRCKFSLDELRYEYPEELAPAGQTPIAYLRHLAWQGARQRYGEVPQKVRRLLKHELELIEELRYEAFFLTVYDLVRFARSRGILCQGRGSAANSVVCYCLEITAVDPQETDLLFERFVSRERDEAPDIDVDFEHERREEVLQYVYEKYTRQRAGMTAEVITYRARSAVREVGKALGLSLDRIDRLARNIDFRSEASVRTERLQQSGIDPDSPIARQLIELVDALQGFPRHLSQHVGGMVITQGPLCELVPIENAAMPGRTVIEWDKNDLDELGILKVDCLALGMLTAIRKCFGLIEKHYGRRLEIANFTGAHDDHVYEMISAADTIGVFQIESRAQMSMLPRLRPKEFYDLVIEVAIVRPGPIQGDMVHPYLRRRNKEEEVSYPNREIEQVLHRTLGVPLFQEQAMQLAVVAAGFTPGQADQLRRAMGGWRRPGLIDQFRQKLIEGMLARGYDDDYAQRLFNQIRGFGEYGFPESHAASFARLVYVSAWLKCYYPAAFTASLINSQPMGFYAPAQLVQDARQHGVEVLPIDVNESCWDCTLEGRESGRQSGKRKAESRADGEGVSLLWVAGVERSEPPEVTALGATESCATGVSPVPVAGTTDTTGVPLMQPTQHGQDARGTPTLPAETTSSALGARCARPQPPQFQPSLQLRLGMRLIRGLSESVADAIMAARSSPYRSLTDLAKRANLRRVVLERLADADAFGSLGLDRRGALWQALDQPAGGQSLPLFADLPDGESRPPALPGLSVQQEVFADYHSAGLTLRAHPISFYRQQLDDLGVTPAENLHRLPHNRPVAVAGLVLIRQRPSTAKGITFVTLEDETGTSNLVVHYQIWQRYYQPARTAQALLVRGRLERQGQVIHIIAQRLEDLATHTATLNHKSRDFR